MGRLKGEHEPAFSHALARVVNLVHRHTGGWHDDEVSLLVSDAKGEVVDRTTHQRWRQNHKDLLEWAGLRLTQDVLAGIENATRR
jgi:hypothetical protein